MVIISEEFYGFIYITTNHINGKKYIGQKKYDERDDWKDYLGSGLYLKRAIKKYGRENFTKDIIENCSTKESLNHAERYWIKKYNAMESNDFYNIASGGQGGNIYEYLDENSANEIKNKLSETHKDIYIGERNNKSKLTENQVIEIVDRLLNGEHYSELCKEFNVSKSTIFNIKNHKTWTYLTENIVFPNDRKMRNDGKEIVQYDKYGNMIANFKNIRDGEKKTGIDHRHISAVCNGKKLSAGGYTWRFKDDDFNKYSIERSKIWTCGNI